jgi:hypothetical protein
MGNILYYPTQTDAQNETNLIISRDVTTHAIETINGISQWKIIKSTNGAPFDINRIYNAGDSLSNAEGYNYYLYPANDTTTTTSTIAPSTTSSVLNEINPTLEVQHNINFNNNTLLITGDITLPEGNTELKLPIGTTLVNGNGKTINVPTSIDAVINTQNNKHLIVILNTIIRSPYISNIGGGSFIEKNTKNIKLINCSFYGNLNNLNQGGIIGSGCKNIILENCHFYGDINSEHCGGLIGKRCYNIKIYNCSVNGNIVDKYSSGLVGSYSKKIRIYKSYFNGIKMNEKTGYYLGLKCKYVKITIEKHINKRFKNNLYGKHIRVKYI